MTTVMMGSMVGLLTIWLGYPIAVWLVASAIRRGSISVHSETPPEGLSIILATRDSAENITRRVSNLLHTRHPADRIEILIALDAAVAESRTSELQFSDPRIRLVTGDLPPGKAGALNAGVRSASHDLLVMCDTKQDFDSDTIPALAAAMNDRRFGAVSGALTLGGSGTPVHWYWRLEKWLRENEARLHSSVGVTGAVYATRKSLWTPIPAGTILDDVFTPMALVLRGYRVGFERSARAVDVRTFGDDAEQERKGRTLTGVLQLMKLLPDISSPRRNPIWIQFVFHKLLRFATPFLVLVIAIAASAEYVRWFIAGTAFQRAVLVGVPVATLLVPPVRVLVFRVLRWGMAMQKALLTALTNGAKGRYDVWTQSR